MCSEARDLEHLNIFNWKKKKELSNCLEIKHSSFQEFLVLKYVYCLKNTLKTFIKNHWSNASIKQTIIPLWAKRVGEFIEIMHKKISPTHILGRHSGNDFGRFSVSFFEGRISYIRAACNYPTRNANLKRSVLGYPTEVGFVSRSSNFMSLLVVLSE